MKKFLIVFIFFVGFTSLSLGNNGKTKDISAQILKLINEVKNTPPSERYKKMNQLKLLVKKLKAEERIKIMKKLHQQLQNSKDTKLHEHMHRYSNTEHFTHKEHMEMRNMHQQHRDNFKQEIHNDKKIEDFHGGGNGRWGERGKDNKNKGDHGKPWDHFR